MRITSRTIVSFCVGVLLVCPACGRSARTAAPPSERLELQSADGVQLVATLYPAPGPNPPGLVLVHMMGADRHGWEPFALRAQREGYTCIALDLRGHGESILSKGQRLTYRTFDTEDWLAATQDIDAARLALLEHGAAPGNVALVGASLGANLVLHYAIDQPAIQAIVLISPGRDFRGIAAEPRIADYGNRPVLLLAAEGDEYAAASCRSLKNAASGLCELRYYPGAAHGTDLFASSLNATDQVFVWLKPIIGAKQSG